MNSFLFFLVYFCVLAESQLRLPTTVIPTLYTIKLNLNLEEETFTGKVNIYVTIVDSVKSIKFHSSNLTIENISLNRKNISYYDARNEYQLIEIWDKNKIMIPPGTHIINIKYNGRFSKPSSGLFKTGVTYENKTLTHLVATDFEPCFARTVFPCFDEPYFKAKFQLTLVVPDDSYKAISNMDLHKSFKTSEGIVYKFTTLLTMSTYLLAFAVHQLPFQEYQGCYKTPIKAYSVKSNATNVQKVLKYVDQSLMFYAQYTNYSYPLPKIDMIEYDRFNNTATENWGLITMITGLLSPEDDVYDDSQKFSVITHEIAHFWFGDLVTNQWWDDIWLNEGIATYMALKAGDNIKRDNSSLKYAFETLEDVYYLDIGENLNPVVNYEENPLEIMKNFNDAAYVKGARIMGMIELALGEHKFRCAIINYIRSFAYKTANTNDFLTIFEKYTDNKMEFRNFVESYLYQNEYPIITVAETTNEYILSQTRCDESSSSESRFEYKWTIPLTYITDLADRPQFIWFDKDMDNLIIPKQNEKWIKFNYKQNGYYRTNYVESLWKKFYDYNNELESYERDHLILEATAMLDAQKISCDIFLQYILSLGKNTNADYVFISLARLKLGGTFDMETYDLVSMFLAKMSQDNKQPDVDLIIRLKNLSWGTKNPCVNWIHKYLFRF